MAAGGEVFLAGEGGRLAAPPGHPRADQGNPPQGRRTNTAVIIEGGVEARGNWGADVLFFQKEE